MWLPKSVFTFVEDYFNGLSYFDMATKHNGSNEQVNHFVRHLKRLEGLPDRKSIKDGVAPEWVYQGIAERSEFKRYLLKSRTMREMTAKFGAKVGDLLSDGFEGLHLFEQRNNQGEMVYILLPQVNLSLDLQPRIVKHHTSFNEAGQQQPYLLVDLPDSLFSQDEEGEAIILPIYDVHFGHVGHKREKFLSYLRYIAETPNVVAFLGGDLMENALDDGRGMTYDSDRAPMQQLHECVEMLAPIAHKIMFALPGNHEWRTYKVSGLDPMRYLADRLEIPYFDGPVYVSMVWNEYKWKMHAGHGYGSSTTKGGKMNRAGGPRKYFDFLHFIVSGHVHDPVVNSETTVVEDPINCRLIYPQTWTVIAPSFLRWEGTYAYRAGYAPPGSGGVSLRLFKNGDYRAQLGS